MKIQVMGETRMEWKLGEPVPAEFDNGMLRATCRWKDLDVGDSRKVRILRLEVQDDDGSPIMVLPVESTFDHDEEHDSFIQFGDRQFGLEFKIERGK